MQGKQGLMLTSIASLFAVMVVGAYVAAAGFGDSCGPDWPTCLGSLIPPPQLGPIMEYLHRILALLASLFLLLTTVAYWRAQDAEKTVKRTVYAAMALIVVQVFLGGAVIFQVEAAATVAAHQALAALTFGVAVAAFARARAVVKPLTPQ